MLKTTVSLKPAEVSKDWVLIDAGDVLVHLFRPEVRAFYNLEKMWDVDLPEGFAGFTADPTFLSL